MNQSILIEKHLADGLGDEEIAALEAAVCAEPEAADRLVAAARLDERLAVRLGAGRAELTAIAGLRGTRVVVPSAARRRRAFLAAAAMLLGLGLLAAVGVWVRSTNAPSAAGAAAGTAAAPRLFVPGPVPPAPVHTPVVSVADRETPAMASLRRFLSSYYLTDLKLESARPLAQALERLLQRARELNHLKNPFIERLSAELAAPEDGDGRPDAVVALPLKDVSLMDGLKWVAAMTRSEVFLKEPGVITFRPWEPDENGTLVTEVVRVRPDLLTRPVAIDPQDPADGDAVPSRVGTDPFVETIEAQAVPRLTPVELFQSWGIAFGEQASASYDEATAAMTIRHTASSLRVIKELLAMGSARSQAMIMISTKILEFAHARPIKDELLTDQQFQLWLREMNQTKGVDLLAAPQITIRSGQRGMVEVGGGPVLPGDGEPTPTDVQVEWQVLRIPIEPVLEGEVVKVVGAVELRLPVHRPPGRLLPPQNLAASESELETTATDFEAIIPPGQTAVFSVSESPEGPHFAMAVTAVTIDPSGQRVGAPEEEPDPAPFPQQESDGRRAGP